LGFQGIETMLDFIERYLGIFPDGGDGSIEVLVVVALTLVTILLALRLGAKTNKAR
jgi:hypothetical protein